MRRWNEGQPGGQGLATDFEIYYKTLTDADKLVSQSVPYGND